MYFPTLAKEDFSLSMLLPATLHLISFVKFASSSITYSPVTPLAPNTTISYFRSSEVILKVVSYYEILNRMLTYDDYSKEQKETETKKKQLRNRYVYFFSFSFDKVLRLQFKI